MLIEARFLFDTEEDESKLTFEHVEDWAHDVNDTFACFVIGYQGWSVNEINESNSKDAA